MNKGLLTENIKKPLPGTNPKVDALGDLLHKPGYMNNSWFIVSNFQDKGHTLNFLFHFITMNMPVIGDRFIVSLSVTDETAGTFWGGHKVYKPSEVEMREDCLSITTPCGYMKGTMDDLRFYCKFDNIELNGQAVATGYPIYSKRTGAFQLLGTYVHQYSFPHLETTGTLTKDGESYTLSGYSWFDRQWQGKFGCKGAPRWTWVAVYLDNGEVLSIFDCDKAGFEQRWVTIQHPDGSHEFAEIEPLEIGASRYWKSEKSGECYPTKLTVRIPRYDSEIVIDAHPLEQELATKMLGMEVHQYEAACRVTGIHKGQQVTGHACLEMLGNWPENK